MIKEDIGWEMMMKAAGDHLFLPHGFQYFGTDLNDLSVIYTDRSGHPMLVCEIKRTDGWSWFWRIRIKGLGMGIEMGTPWIHGTVRDIEPRLKRMRLYCERLSPSTITATTSTETT